jgi:hypothetical protein
MICKRRTKERQVMQDLEAAGGAHQVDSRSTSCSAPLSGQTHVPQETRLDPASVLRIHRHTARELESAWEATPF